MSDFGNNVVGVGNTPIGKNDEISAAMNGGAFNKPRLS